MPTSLYFTTGQVAHQLGASQAQIRALCESGTIASECTPGGQFRIASAEVERLKRAGLPQMPRPLPQEAGPAARNGRTPRRAHPLLLDIPSAQAIAAADQLVTLDNEVKVLDLKREKEEKLDFFRAREQQQAEEERVRRQAEECRKAEAEAERAREERDNRWLAYAMRGVPRQAVGEVEGEIHEQVLAALETVGLTEPYSVVQRVVDAAFNRAMKPWYRANEIKQVIEDARESLPYEIRGLPWNPTPWDVQARTVAAKALQEMRPDADGAEMRAVAREAVKTVIAAYEAQKAAEADRKMRQSILRSTRLPDGLSDPGKELALKAIAEAVDALPQGTPRNKLEQACTSALAPFHAAIEKARAEEQVRREAEARQRQDRANRESVLAYASWRFPYDLPESDRTKATEAARQAIAALPTGTAKHELEAARDRAVQPHLDAHDRRKRAAPLIEAGLREILPYVRRLESDWEFDESAAAVEAELTPTVRARLAAELTGKEGPNEVAETVRRLVRELLGIHSKSAVIS